MAFVGQTITHPQTGEQITFRRITDEALELDFVVAPGGAPAARHIHPQQVERFAVHSGVLRITVGKDESTVGPGDGVTVPPGVPHIWHAADGQELRMTLTFEPALTAAPFFEQFFALANAGRIKADGGLRLLDAAVVLDDNRDFLYLAKPPIAVQKALFRLLAPIGRRLRRGRVPVAVAAGARA